VLFLIDIGANLAHDSFDEDREQVLQRAAAVGVSRIVITGSCDKSNVLAADLAKQAPGFLYATAGVHPHHAAHYSDASESIIRTLADSRSIVAIGECGLDYFRDLSPRAAQSETFQRQISIAQETGLPLFLHQRDAHDDFVRILEPALDTLTRAVAHCFTGNEAALRDYVSLDLYIGITGWICDERRGKPLYDIVSLIPDDRLLIETDAPYLMPRTIRPRPKTRRNEPANLPEVLTMLAAARNQSTEHVARITTQNALRFFALQTT
jgi:TatD DNase family protein